jgi:hypothetical protein
MRYIVCAQEILPKNFYYVLNLEIMQSSHYVNKTVRLIYLDINWFHSDFGWDFIVFFLHPSEMIFLCTFRNT